MKFLMNFFFLISLSGRLLQVAIRLAADTCELLQPSCFLIVIFQNR